MYVKKSLFSKIIDMITLPQNENSKCKELIMKKYLKSNDKVYLDDDLYHQLIKDVNNSDIFENENKLEDYFNYVDQKTKESKKVDNIFKFLSRKRNGRTTIEIFKREGSYERAKANDLFHGYTITLDNEAYFDMYRKPSIDYITELLCRVFGVNSVVWKFTEKPVIPVKFRSSILLKFNLPNETDSHLIRIEVSQWL